MQYESLINDILRKELICSIGCTEPSTIAYAVSFAKEQIPFNEEIEKIDFYASSNILKNALCVTIPNTNVNGIIMIIMLAILRCKSSDKLTILNNILPDDIEKANILKNKIDINILLKENVNPLFIEVNIKTKNHKVNVIVEQYHDMIKTCIVDGKLIFDNNYNLTEMQDTSVLNFNNIFNFVKERRYDITLIENVRKANYEVGNYGLEHKVGLNVGESIKKLRIYNKKISNVISTTVAGIDSRMGGAPKKVFINSGSGNQGLTATIPIVEFAKQYNISDELELDALAMSHLITLYVRSRQRKLSSSCGAICAAAGVSAGIAYMLECNQKQIEGAVTNTLCSNFGVFCDGAKDTCSFKVASAISCAINSALLAKNNVHVNDIYGVISPSLDDTLETLSVIENKLTESLDKIIMNEAINVKGEKIYVKSRDRKR